MLVWYTSLLYVYLTNDCPIAPPIMNTKPIIGIIFRAFKTLSAILWGEGIKFLCLVLFINPLKQYNNPGIKKKTVMKLHKIPLVKTIPISKPILNCINIKAINPDIVVKELANIEGIELAKVDITASFGFLSKDSSAYLWAMIIA